MKSASLIMVVCLVAAASACASNSKAKPLHPLALTDGGVTPQALTLTEQGTHAYETKQFDEARSLFAQAMAAAPQSGQAHYNYALALNALGDAEAARQHFVEAANLAPGDKTIWDSPALAPFGNPSSPKAYKEHPYGTTRPTIGSGPR